MFDTLKLCKYLISFTLPMLVYKKKMVEFLILNLMTL